MRTFGHTPHQRLGLAALALLAFTAVGCAAQDNPSQAEQDQSCPPPEKESLRAVNFQPPPAQPYSQAERACWIDWNSAQKLAQSPNAQWVDARETGAAQRLRLVGALPVPRQQVEHSAALRGLDLLIVGEDFDLRTLSRQCVTWRQSKQFAGVHVVLGGVRAWRLAGQPVQADMRATQIQPPEVLAPAEYWRGLNAGLWRVATLGVDADQVTALKQPVALTIPTADAAALETLRQTLAQTPKSENQSTPAPSWLVVTADAKTQAQLQTLWNQQQGAAKQMPTLLWLGGGLRALGDYLAEQQQLAAHAGHALPRLCGMGKI